MSRSTWFFLRGNGMIGAAMTVLIYHLAAAAFAAETAEAGALGRIDFEGAKLPPANVELELGQATFSSLFGVSDAAVAGIAETLMKSAEGEHAESTKLAAEQLAAVRQVIGLVNKVVHEVRVRAYEKMAEDLSAHFEKQLENGDWQRIALVRKGDESARVYAIYRDNAIRGVFVIASGHGGQALVNVVCDVSPENVKSITAAATKIGLDNGLEQVIEMKLRRMHDRGRHMGPGPAGGTSTSDGAAAPAPPQPPRPPQAPKREAA
jgi:hypothetical protein